MAHSPAIPRGSLLSEIDHKISTGGFKSFGHLAMACYRRRDSPQAAEALDDWKSLCQKAPFGLYGDSDPDGGVLIPPTYAGMIWERMRDANAIFPLLDSIPVAGREYELPILKEDSRVDGSRHGGLRSYWIEEGFQRTKSQPVLRNVNLRLKKLALLVYATVECLSDAPALGAWLPKAAAKEINFGINAEVVSGLGGGRPLGILNSGSKVTVSAVSGQGASTIVLQNILDMYARVPVSLRPSLAWLYNPGIEKSLFRMQTASGQSAATGLLRPDPDKRGGWLLMNAPALPIEQCPAPGTEGDIIAFATDGYAAIHKGSGIDSALSMHLRFDYDDAAFRITLRFDGQPKDNVALTPYLGSDTQSGIVTLSSTRT